MTEEDIKTIFAGFREIRETLQAFAASDREKREALQALASSDNEQRNQINQNTRDIAELKQAVALQLENYRSVSSDVERVNSLVERLATEAAQDRAEIRQIWEYLMQQRGNGRSD